MSCSFCGNKKVKTYADCKCIPAWKFLRSTRKGDAVVPEQHTSNCDECNLILTPQDVTTLRLEDGKLTDTYMCPRCGHQQTKPRMILKARYK